MIFTYSDCKFVINCIKGKWKTIKYYFKIKEIQKIIIQDLYNNIPEIYWIKAHNKIPGNEEADKLAKEARIEAELKQPKLLKSINKNKLHTNNNDGLTDEFINYWNIQWTNPFKNEFDKWTKSIIKNINESNWFYKEILLRLNNNELRIICRLISGKVCLNYYLNKMKIKNNKNCDCAKENEKIDETIEHYLLECNIYKNYRIILFNKVKKYVGNDENEINCKLLLTGFHNKFRYISLDNQLLIIRSTIQFVLNTNKKI